MSLDGLERRLTKALAEVQRQHGEADTLYHVVIYDRADFRSHFTLKIGQSDTHYTRREYAIERIIFEMTVLQEKHLPHSKGGFSHTRKRGQRIKRGERRNLKREFLRCYPQAGAPISDICRQIGIGRCTFYAWLKRDTEFRARYQSIIDAREEAEEAEFQRFLATIELERAQYWQNLTDGALSRALSVMTRRRART